MLTVSAAMAQESHLSMGGGPAWKGMEIWFVTKIEPPGTRLPGGVAFESGRAHHIIDDRAHKRAFGYDVVLDAGEDGKTAQLRILPLNRAEAKIPFEPGWTFVGLPNYPVVSNVKIGDTVALDLLVNRATGQKVVDYLTLRRHGDMDLQHEARDFQLSDVELTLSDPQIVVEGKPEAPTGAGGISGAVIWLYVSGHGRFILSLVPNEKLGFRKNGIVSGDGLLVRDGGVEIRVDSNGRIAPGPGVYNLYVAHEPDWRPTRERSTIGSADRAEYVVGEK
jgi:hypothetical protein